MADIAVSNEILSEIKRSLNVTWDDEETDRKIINIICNAVYYINSKLGSQADFTQPGFPKMLLTEYCRYAYNEALDAFETNYMSMILAMQFERQVDQNEETT